MNLQKYIASVSFGKDSLAMLLLLIEKKYPLDEVIFFDWGMEFQCIYDLRDKIKPLLEEKGIKFVEVHSSSSFEEIMYEKPVKHKDGTTSNGYGWCGGKCRWGTRAKTLRIKKYLNNAHPYGYYEYIGIAADELDRINNKQNEGKLMPLVEWGMTEKDCLDYCHQQGYFWNEGEIELYQILKRVSCWCCANKNLKELRAYYDFLPQYWSKLKEMQNKTAIPFYRNKETVEEIEKRFYEEEW